MSTQAVRNNITTSIRRIITDVKKKALIEGKKKILELKDELLSPETIIRILSADINQDSCSIKGRQKFEDKVTDLLDQLNLEDKIGAISSKAEIPNVPNPIKGIQDITDAIKPITSILQYVIMAAPAILAASTGPAANGVVITSTNNNVNLAKAKIGEFTNLFSALPRVLDSYISKADIVFDNITKIKTQIQLIVNEIDKLKAFINYLELDFLSKCNELQLPINPPTPNPPIINQIPPPLTLEQVIKDSEELYGNLLESLIAQGQTRAIRRVYALGVQLQRIKNTKVQHINI